MKIHLGHTGGVVPVFCQFKLIACSKINSEKYCISYIQNVSYNNNTKLSSINQYQVLACIIVYWGIYRMIQIIALWSFYFSWNLILAKVFLWYHELTNSKVHCSLVQPLRETALTKFCTLSVVMQTCWSSLRHQDVCVLHPLASPPCRLYSTQTTSTQLTRVTPPT